MHEVSIVEGVMDSVIPLAKQNGATRISVIRLRIGEMTDIVPEALDFAWDVVCDERGPLVKDCRLEIETVKPRFACMECGAEYDADRLHPRCPVCGSGKTLIERGRELEILSFDVETPDDSDTKNS